MDSIDTMSAFKTRDARLDAIDVLINSYNVMAEAIDDDVKLQQISDMPDALRASMVGNMEFISSVAKKALAELRNAS